MRRDPLREGYLKLIKSIEPNIFVTLGVGAGLRPITFAGKATHFINLCQRRAYGRAWSKRPAHERVHAVGFIEHPDTNLHMHLALRAPTPELRKAVYAGEGAWLSLTHAGHYYAVPFRESADRVARYITKTFHSRACREEPFIYAPRRDLLAN